MNLMYWLLLLCYIIFFFGVFININAKKYIFFIVSVLSILAYNYDPIYAYEKLGFYSDLYRIFNDMDMFRYMGDEYMGYMTAPLSRMYISFFVIFDDNSLLPFVTCIIYYGIYLFFIYKLGINNDIKNKYILVVIFFVVSITNYSVVIGNIRYSIATMIYVICLYYDLVKDKKIYCLGYIISILMHPGTFIYLLIRCLVKEQLKKSIVISVLLIILLNFIEEILSVLSILSPVFFGDILSKFLLYKDVSNFDEATTSTYMIYILIIAVISILVYIVKKQLNVVGNNDYNRLMNLLILDIIITVGFIFNYQLLSRILSLGITLLPILMLLDFKCNNNKNRMYYYIVISFIYLFFYFGQTYGYNGLTFGI